MSGSTLVDISITTMILDNGSYAIKSDRTGDTETPNALIRGRDKTVYVGQDLTKCKDYASLVFKRPSEKGQLINWDIQKAVWDNLFYNPQTGVDTDSSLLLTQYPLTLPQVSANIDQVVFEEYGFEQYHRTEAANLVAWSSGQCLDACLVVDAGFNATHVTPVLFGQVHEPGIRRVNVGGKTMTNLLKETVSFRHYNMMDETYIINRVKEKVCFVSQDFDKDLDLAKKTKSLQVEYALPDYKTTKLGYVVDRKQHDISELQTLKLGNERFTMPEILFDPSIIDLQQSGLCETIAESIQASPKEFRSLLCSNIVIVGGCAKLPGFQSRLEKDLRPLIPSEYHMKTRLDDKPDFTTLQGGKVLVDQPGFSNLCVTKQEYDEYGWRLCRQRFQGETFDEDTESA